MFGFCKSAPEIPIEQLDYRYIETCQDVDKLQKILKILRSGEEGCYPSLELHTEQQLAKCKPDSYLLEKRIPEKLTSDLPRDEKDILSSNLKDFISIKTESSILQEINHNNIPPIRTTANIDVNEPKETHKSKKNVAPRSYEEWAKLDKTIEKDENSCVANVGENTKENAKKKTKMHEMLEAESAKFKDIPPAERQAVALQEKYKGNEAFHCGDFMEALIYYNRSITIDPEPLVYNNRAITHIKLENYENALEDANLVIQHNPSNIKAYLRRGIANQSLKHLDKALLDFTKVIELDPKNKRGKELYEKVYKELEKSAEKLASPKKGKRLIIEEIDSKDESDAKVQSTNCPSETKMNNSIKNVEITKAPTLIDKPAKLEQQKLSKKVEIVETESNEKRENNTLTTVKCQTTNDNVALREENSTSVCIADVKTVIKELPGNVVTIKNEGNEFFRNGAYPEALEKYTHAIHQLMDEPKEHATSLATLFSNRAACHMKIGNCQHCIKDCNKSIEFGATAKAYLRRATAYETVEKYLDAYVDYITSLKLDSNSLTATQATSRLSALLKSEYGSDWREKLPKQPSIVNQVNVPSPSVYKTMENKHPVSQKNINTSEEKKIKTESIVTADIKPPSSSTSLSPDEKFKLTKEHGNKCVQEGKYDEAILFYTECIKLLPKEVPSYTNRALCYLKLSKLHEAQADCTTALSFQCHNVKALFRRSQARKLLKDYRNALSDLSTILKLEPKNSAAKKESDLCKELFRKELREIQEQNTKQLDGKGKKIVIEEVTSAKPPGKKTAGKMSTKATTCPTAKHGTYAKPSKPKKITSFEFFRMLSNIKSNNSSQFAEILTQVEPERFPELLSNKLDGELLKNFVHAIHDHFTETSTYKHGVQLVTHLCKATRFTTANMMLSKKDQEVFKKMVLKLESSVQKNGADKTLLEDISGVKLILKL